MAVEVVSERETPSPAVFGEQAHAPIILASSWEYHPTSIPGETSTRLTDDQIYRNGGCMCTYGSFSQRQNNRKVWECLIAAIGV